MSFTPSISGGTGTAPSVMGASPPAPQVSLGSTASLGTPPVAAAAAAPPTDVISISDDTYFRYLIESVYKDPFSFYTSDKTDVTMWGRYFPYALSWQIVADDGTYFPVPCHRITLPISPSELQIRMPFASQVTATLRGIIEENNGSPFREISFSGTTGILPTDTHATNQNTYKPPSFMGTIFGGTIAAVGGLASSVSSLLSSPGPPEPAFDPYKAHWSGLGQFLTLYNFLERYALEKRGVPARAEEGEVVLPGKANRLRLVLEMWKENWFWVLTPREFTLRRTANDPHLYFYSFSATAWKRKSSGWHPNTKPYPPDGPIAQRPNGYQNALNTMRGVVKVVVDARNVISAIRTDIHGLMDSLRSTVLFLKEATGAAKDMQDLPTDIKKDIQQTVVRAWKDLKAGFPRPTKFTKGMDDSSTKAGGLTEDQTVKPPDSPSSADEEFNTDTTSSDVGQITLSGLDTPQEISARMEAEFTRCRNLLKSDFERHRQNLIDISERFATSIGMGSNTYSFLVGSDSDSDVVTVVQPTNPLPVTDEQLDVLHALQNALQVLDALVASATIDDNQIVDSINYVAALANAANIPFNVPISKYLVPVPYGATLETISMLYLQDPNRWSEIATLNGLLPPYIDETGFVLKFQTNGSGNQFTVANSTNLYIGQTVQLYSTTVSTIKRHITSIVKLTDTSFLITVDGAADLSTLTVAKTASMKAFLPGTANSEQLIYMPGKGQAEDDPKLSTIPGINDTDTMIKLSGIDLLLTTYGDLIITEDGDTRLAYGMSGLVQALKLVVAVPRGSLMQHPGWGLGISAGTSVADMTPEFVRKAVDTALAQDNRFTGVKALQILMVPPTLQINISTTLGGTAISLPVSVQMPLPS